MSRGTLSRNIVNCCFGVIILGASANRVMAWQSPQADKHEPLALDDSTTSTTTETTTSSEGFWFWPEPAPLKGPISTDRPGFSDSANLVPRGHIQIESGYTYTYDSEHGTRINDHSAPQLAFRTGLTDWMELRIQWAGYSWSKIHTDDFKTQGGRTISRDTHEDGAYDMNLGFKFPIVKQGCWWPTISVIPSLYVPSGSDNKSANNVVPELKFPWNYAINDCWTVYGSVLGRVPDGDRGQFYQTAVTLAGGYKINDCISVYLEYLGIYKTAPGQDCTHLLSTGPVFKITDNISLDTRVSCGLNEQAPDFQASIGFGIRY
jgi:hypothetical protein